MLSKKLAVLVAASLVTASSAAVAQSAQPLSVASSVGARSGATTADAANLDRRGYGIYIVGAVVLAAIIYGIVKLVDHNKNNPTSP